MNKGWFFFFITVVFLPGFLFADSNLSVPGGWQNKGGLKDAPEMADYLGLNLLQAFETLGIPEEVFSFRGEEEWQDNVVFYYAENFYLFWFDNRVWQLRADRRYEGDFLGIEMGMEKDKILTRLGEPYFSDDESVVYNLPDRGVPVRMRLFFSEGNLTDLYIYRGDF